MSNNRIPSRHRPIVHPGIVRAAHWLNALAVVVLIASGLEIHNAYPIVPWRFPRAITLGGWLGGALQWHFAAMWVASVAFAVQVVHGLASGRYRRRFLPLRPADVWRDGRAALAGRLNHNDPGACNAVQKLFYVGVLVLVAVAILSGLALWKPVQLALLAAALGGFEGARIVHFAAMAGIAAFLLLHVAMAVLVPASLRAMVVGRAPARWPEADR